MCSFSPRVRGPPRSAPTAATQPWLNYSTAGSQGGNLQLSKCASVKVPTTQGVLPASRCQRLLDGVSLTFLTRMSHQQCFVIEFVSLHVPSPPLSPNPSLGWPSRGFPRTTCRLPSRIPRCLTSPLLPAPHPYPASPHLGGADDSSFSLMGFSSLF